MKKQKNKKTPHKILDVSFNLYKKVKFFIRLALVTVIAGIIGIVIIIKNTDPNKYKDDITISIEKMTGNTVKINGDLKWKIFSFEPAIKIEELSIKNEPWGRPFSFPLFRFCNSYCVLFQVD